MPDMIRAAKTAATAMPGVETWLPSETGEGVGVLVGRAIGFAGADVVDVTNVELELLLLDELEDAVEVELVIELLNLVEVIEGEDEEVVMVEELWLLVEEADFVVFEVDVRDDVAVEVAFAEDLEDPDEVKDLAVSVVDVVF
jgi:hypothetical protein